MWTRKYDLMGRLSESVDPDSGAQSTTYDDGGRVASTTDVRGTVTFGYDAIGRKISESVGGTPSASWVYDTLVPGQLTSSTRTVGSAKYTRAITGYDQLYGVPRSSWDPTRRAAAGSPRSRTDYTEPATVTRKGSVGGRARG
jgi:YD repeat-containing protein